MSGPVIDGTSLFPLNMGSLDLAGAPTASQETSGLPRLFTHRVDISNKCIVDFDSQVVYFRYEDYLDGKNVKMLTLADEFLRRFLLHVSATTEVCAMPLNPAPASE